MFLKQKISGFFLLLILVGGLFSAGFVLAWEVNPDMYTDKTYSTPAIGAEYTATLPLSEKIQNAAAATARVIEKTWKSTVFPALKEMAVTALFDLVTYSADTVAKNTAVWLANGAPGQEPLYQVLTGYDSWKSFGLGLAAEGLGSLSEGIVDNFDIHFNLCAPSSPALRVGLQIGILGMYQPTKPKCEWQAVAENWDGFMQNLQEDTKDPTSQALNMLAKSFQPGQSSLAYLSIVNNKMIFPIDEKKNADFMESLFSLGIKPVTDANGKVITPSIMVQQRIKDNQTEATYGKTSKYFDIMLTNGDIWQSIAYQSIKIFTTTLVGTFVQNLQTGYFNGLYQDINIDPFDELSESSSTIADSEAYYSDLVSTTPVALTEYSVLSEFVACPQSPNIRQLNNCVADASLIQGIGRSYGTEIITVASAIEAGFLHGDWPFFKPDDIIHNQDSLCYTYGYCYGNLVKLRKARIISVGWEMAAASSENSASDPVTLQEVVNGFNSCNGDGQADSSHPWCHMIDPNWVFKYPQQRCDASMIGELSISSMISARSAACVDSPSCLAENDDGTCEAYGNCVREKNTWNFNGDSCPEESLSCLNFTNSDSNETGTWLFNSLDQGSCSAENAGCLWYRTNKYLDNGGTADDTSDDAYEWLPGDEVYVTATREDAPEYYGATGHSARATFSYDTDNGGFDDDGSYSIYAYEDRIYLNNEVQACTESEAGCSEIYPIGDNELSLNIIRNPGFEDDVDGDGVADLWSVSTVAGPTYTNDSSLSHQGSFYYNLVASSTLSQEDIPLQQNHSYTFSFYATGVVTATLTLKASDNSAVVLTGYSTDCVATSNTVSLTASASSTSDYVSYDCTFNTPILTNDRLWIVADLNFSGATGVYIDAIQLEARETASTYHDGYNETVTAEYLQIPPDWLGCTGAETDAADCDNYASVCSATEVGCSLYTPTDGDPAVPAVVSVGDLCPGECVGYSTYKQEATDYDTEEFPLYFIADSATACSSSEVGCDEFTNLETEGRESYSQLRACLTPGMADDESEVFFTWEGSDMAGYQLVSYQLLSSDLGDSDTVLYEQDSDGDDLSDITDSDYAGDLVVDYSPKNAPCTIWDVTSESTLGCVDNVTVLAVDDACNEHSDILTNPDCREFYDSLGEIHYRLYSETISVSDDCTAYRKTDANADDCNGSGGYWTASGECRYFIEPNESTVCSATGCREYTGGGSRNSSVILSEYFEDGSYDNFENAQSTTATLAISNESVAVDGHSLRVVAGSSGSVVRTLQDYTTSKVECADPNGCASASGVCTVAEGDIGCGVLNDSLVAGKTYVVKFWAKGIGSLMVSLFDNGGLDDSHNFGDSIALTSSWQLYELGPIDTSVTGFEDFDENAVLTFSASAASQIFYLDNIQLEQTEEDLTLVKDSWVTPSICDETPEGAVSVQYYLGCEEYTNQNDVTYNIFEFSSLCSEKAVGCDDYYVTQNSEATYAQIFNASCNNTDDAGDYISDTVTSPKSCTVTGLSTGQELCTIAVGKNQCQFDYDGTLPTPMAGHLSFGPETVYVPADEVAYLISDDEFSCTSDNKGCTEIGLPTFSNDNSLVTSFESVYLLNQPDSYSDILCADDELFCGEWATTKAENYYFKNPGNKSCEYKTGVSLNSTSYDGWFRTGTTEFCYGSGVCTGDADNNGDLDDYCDNDANCSLAGAGTCTITNGSYLKNGTVSGLWFNGDTNYDGWAGTCDSAYDYCTEFIDPLDTKENENLEGMSYFYLDNDTIDEENNLSTDRCNGQISLQEGCTLFNDVMSQELTYASSPSYLLSEHADIFFGEDPRSFQDPVSCDDTANGEFSTTTGDSFNVCTNRCAYSVDLGNNISNLSTIEGSSDTTTTTFYGSACVYNTDCQLGIDNFNNEVTGYCENLDTTTETPYVFANDTNRVLKVYRDRECAEWLACSSSYDAWDERTAQWTDVCQEVDLCDDYSVMSDEGSCSSWSDDRPTVLDSSRYTSRDVSWYGMDYSGYAIPEQLPVQYYDQENIVPFGYCTVSGALFETESNLIPCQTDSDCSLISSFGLIPACTDIFELSSALEEKGIDTTNYHLVYPASTCDEANNEPCTAGYCTNTGNPCSDDGQCSPDGSCIVGNCEKSSTTSCVIDRDCMGSEYPECKNGVCTDTLLGDPVVSLGPDTVLTCGLNQVCTVGKGECVPGALAKNGTCYNNVCLVGIDGQPFVDDEKAEEKTCRGYPEISSPYTYRVVEEWLDPDYLADSFEESYLKDYELLSNSLLDSIYGDNLLDAVPYTYVYGFNDAQTCAPTQTSGGENKINDDCLCSYDKAEYGEGAISRYYPLNTSVANVLPGVCMGGNKPGASCDDDSGCNQSGEDTGLCQRLTRKDVTYGWDGYCIERDSSIQLFGSSDSNDRACLSWYPIDQLEGSRNAYANDTEAGFSLTESAYYCTEVGYYADLYPTGVTFNDDGSVADMVHACAENTSEGSGDGCDYSEYVANVGDGSANCAQNAFCPDGYYALVGFCDQDNDSGTNESGVTDYEGDSSITPLCSDGGSEDNDEEDVDSAGDRRDKLDDCPYFCIPEGSFHSEGTDAGVACDDFVSGMTAVNTLFDNVAYKVGDLFSTDSGLGDQTFKDYMQDCVRRGVVIGQESLGTNPFTEGRILTFVDGYAQGGTSQYGFYHLAYKPINGGSPGNCSYSYNECSSSEDCPVLSQTCDLISDEGTYSGYCSETGVACYTDSTSASYNPCETPVSQLCITTTDLSAGSYAPYLGCYELTQVSSPEEGGNKAWTNRLWSGSGYETTTSGSSSSYSENYNYQAGSLPEVAGQAMFEEYFNLDDISTMKDVSDSWPLPVASCGDNSSLLYTKPPDSTDCETNNYPNTDSSLAAPYEEITADDASSFVTGVQEEYFDAQGSSRNSTATSIKELLQQMFAQVFDVWRYDWDCLDLDNCTEGDDTDGGGGGYKEVGLNTYTAIDLSDDISALGDNNYAGSPTPPTIASLGECDYNANCLEGEEGKFSVNGYDSDNLSGSDGSYNAQIKFFAWANSNQMPIRDVTVDWGDGDRSLSDYAWPTDSQTGDMGSTSSYYKNRRGLDNEDETTCSTSADEWGLTSDACETAYFSFEHDYYCSSGFVGTLEDSDDGTCAWADVDTGRLLNSPCTHGVIPEAEGKCVYQPRVHVKDNWGWCTGECDAGLDDESDGCYGEECNPIDCPSGGVGDWCLDSAAPTRRSGELVNPWINYDGVIIVDYRTE